MKLHINEVLDIYENFNIIGFYATFDNEPCNIFVVSDNDIVLAIFESVWSDDFSETEYVMVADHDDFGRKMEDVADEYYDGGYEFRPL